MAIPRPIPVAAKPLPMVLFCPSCGLQHIDAANPDTGWTNPPHRSHLCARCGCIWRPCDRTTEGVHRTATSGQADNWIPGMADAVRDRDARQKRLQAWAIEAFGRDQAVSVPQRALRFLEEAVEAAQAAGVTPDMALNLVNFVYARPPGQLRKEVGQVGVTLILLCEAAEISADVAECVEVRRVLALPPTYWHDRNKAKNDAGFDVVKAGP